MKLISSVITDRVTQLRQCNVGVSDKRFDAFEELSPMRLNAFNFGSVYSVSDADASLRTSDFFISLLTSLSAAISTI